MKTTSHVIINELIDNLNKLDASFFDPLQRCIEISAKAILEDKSIFICGNGGSATTASHITNDLLCHMRNWERKGYRMYCLNDSPSIITSLTNDYGFEHVFEKSLSAQGKKDDVLWAFSTSGNSRNCVVAVEKAKELGITSVGITGKQGGLLKEKADIWIPVNSDDVTRVEELHLICAHILGENIEAIVSPK